MFYASGSALSDFADFGDFGDLGAAKKKGIDLANCKDLHDRAVRNAAILAKKPNDKGAWSRGQLRYGQYMQCMQNKGQAPVSIPPFSVEPSLAAAAQATPAASAAAAVVEDKLPKAPAEASITTRGPGGVSSSGLLTLGGVLAAGFVLIMLTQKKKSGRRR